MFSKQSDSFDSRRTISDDRVETFLDSSLNFMCNTRTVSPHYVKTLIVVGKSKNGLNDNLQFYFHSFWINVIGKALSKRILQLSVPLEN